MGLTGGGGAVTFLKIKYGKIPVEVKQPTEKSVEYEIQSGPNKGRIVHQELYSGLEGLVLDIFERDGKYGKNWCVVMQDDTERIFQLEFNWSSSYSEGYFSRIEGADLSKPLHFRCGYDEQKKRGFGWLEQDGQKLEKRYTKDNPNGMPPLKKVMYQGKEQWDSYDRDMFLSGIINRLKPALEQNKGRAGNYKPAAQQDTQAPTHNNESQWSNQSSTPSQHAYGQGPGQEYYEEGGPSDDDIPF